MTYNSNQFRSKPRLSLSKSAHLRRQIAVALVAFLSITAYRSLLAATEDSENDNAEALASVVVSGQNTKAEAEERLAKVAGGTSVVNGEDLQRGRVANIADALANQPGVLAKSSNGGEAVRLSIRGSGISRGSYFWGTGLQTQLDGFAVSGPAGSPYESLEPLVLDRIEILRGANGFAYGPLSLGGVVNYVTRTGHNASPFQIRLETGSYGYGRQQLSSGQVLGPLDYYVSLTGFQQDGYRDNSRGNSQRLVFNVGYKINDDLETRFFFRHAQQWQDNPGFVRWQDIKRDRKSTQYAFKEQNVRYNPGSTSLANRTTWQIDADSSLKVGVQWREYTLKPDSNARAGWDTGWWFKELNTFATYDRQDQVLGGRQSNTTASLFYNRLLSADAKGYSQGGGADGTLAGQESYGGSDLIAVLQNDLEVHSGLWLTLGLSGIKQQRDVRIQRSLAWDNGAPRAKSFDYNSLAPRLGIRYEYTPGAQVFANASRSYEAPTSTNYSAAVLGGRYIPEVSAQKANTLELGTSGKQDGLGWSLSWYYSWVKDELLSTQYTTPTGYIATGISNASKTIHQGVEASLDTRVWKAAHSSDELKLRQSYTWSDFRYKNDAVFGSNALPAVPEHLYQAELRYLHHNGLYLSTNLEANLKRFAADYANTIFAKRYLIVGLRGGYTDPSGRWEIYGQADNLTDKAYPAVVNPIYNAAGVDSQVYAVGVGRSFTLGASFNY